MSSRRRIDRARLLGRARAIDAVAGRDQPQARGFRERLARSRTGSWRGSATSWRQGRSLADPLEQDGLDPAYALSIFRLGLLGELGEWSARISVIAPEPCLVAV